MEEYDFSRQVTGPLHLYAVWSPNLLSAFTKDHYAYLIGYQDNTIWPSGQILRSEVATIFFRLIADDYREQNWSKTNHFTDVQAEHWYNNAVSTMTKAGILTGHENGIFAPKDAITRAEFATIVARFTDHTVSDNNRFYDIDTHWTKTYINIAADMGWVTGYGDGSFRPDVYITRAEAAVLINCMMNRQPFSASALDRNMKTWQDNQNTETWYYLAIQEATNNHLCTIDEETGVETWSTLIENRNWSALEKSDATPQSIF